MFNILQFLGNILYVIVAGIYSRFVGYFLVRDSNNKTEVNQLFRWNFEEKYWSWKWHLQLYSTIEKMCKFSRINNLKHPFYSNWSEWLKVSFILITVERPAVRNRKQIRRQGILIFVCFWGTSRLLGDRNWITKFTVKRR